MEFIILDGSKVLATVPISELFDAMNNLTEDELIRVRIVAVNDGIAVRILTAHELAQNFARALINLAYRQN